jgi:hypothetical protein
MAGWQCIQPGACQTADTDIACAEWRAQSRAGACWTGKLAPDVLAHASWHRGAQGGGQPEGAEAAGEGAAALTFLAAGMWGATLVVGVEPTPSYSLMPAMMDAGTP